MNIRIAFVLFMGLLSGSGVVAQISYGGMPLFPDQVPVKSLSAPGKPGKPAVVDMPAFDLDSVLRSDAVNEGNMRGSFSFAHKFHTHIERGTDGNEWILADGSRVWQVGIHSQNAYSINLLFTEFHVPEGGKLFVYNTDHSYIIGAFDHRNNSSAGLLPVRPVAGESIIIEYSEPANVAFPGRLVIGEVNHDYRDIFRVEPGADLTDGSFSCMADVLCQDVDETMIRSTILVMINGTVACTGTLMNNTSNDGAPYVLTAVHCLNSDIAYGVRKNWEYYVDKAGTVVVFFNYNRPVCETQIIGSEDFSIAVARPCAIIENKDIALLELNEKPPLYYNAYYAGWNINTDVKPYTNIHHPKAAVKKYNFYKDDLTWMTFGEDQPVFDANSHLKVAAWTTGSTAKGSSGSPLFDANHVVIGGLSGGWSYCDRIDASGKTHDDFFALVRGWETGNPTNQLKTYLDPNNTGVRFMAGMDPNQQNPMSRISNVPYNNGYNLVTANYSHPNSGFVFGNSNLNINEFAEEFNPEYEAELYGAYLFIPPIPVSSAKGIEIRVYEGSSSPEQLIAQQMLQPQFRDYSSGGFLEKDKTMNTVPTENFVRFEHPIKIGKKFFIAYRIDNSPGSQFVVYNTQSSGSGKTSSAWINRDGTWMRANTYSPQPVITSLAIQALLSYTDVPLPVDKTAKILYIRSANCLRLPDISSESGQAFIYSVSGQLMEQIPFAEAQNSITIRPQPVGTIGIVRVVRGNNIYTGKLIY